MSPTSSSRGERIRQLSLDILGPAMRNILDLLAKQETATRDPRGPRHAEGDASLAFAYMATCDAYTPAAGDPSKDELTAASLAALAESRPGQLRHAPLHPTSTPRPNGFATAHPAMAILLLDDVVPDGERIRIADGTATGADWYLNWRPFAGMIYDTKAEEMAWEVMTLAAAQALNPDHPHRQAWHEKAREMTLNAYSREQDCHDTETKFDGIPLADLVHTANVHPDFTVMNHEGFNPTYQVCNNNLATVYWFYKNILGGVPKWLTWNWRGLHNVMKKVILRDGSAHWPSGCDSWPRNGLSHAKYHALMAGVLGCGVSLWCLEKGLATARAEQIANGDGSFNSRRLPDFPVVFQTHNLLSPMFAIEFAPYDGVPELTDDEAREELGGILISETSEIASRICPRLAASLSWHPIYGRGQALGNIRPSDDSMWGDAWTNIPQLSGTVRLAKGAERDIVADDDQGYINHARVRLTDPGELLCDRRSHIQGRDGDVVWSLGQKRDFEGDVCHNIGIIAGNDWALHIERIVRYGDKECLGGVETLNYMMRNDSIDREGFDIQWDGGEKFLPTENWTLDAPGDRILFDNKLALVRLHGNTKLRMAQYQSEKLRQVSRSEPWWLRIWGEPTWDVIPEAYALLAEQVTLFAAVSSMDEAAALVKRFRVECTPMGAMTIAIDTDELRRTYELECGLRIGVTVRD